ACYPIAMGFTLLYGGEHYLVDELFGAAYALLVIAGWRYLRARRRASSVEPVETMRPVVSGRA
ncbi:MAG TPA: inositol phosphorylceramide synthase, partial [Actinomycetes bacterium]|nr:inositol phosphorylceramide synthase [Actinomycetes bacterium]